MLEKPIDFGTRIGVSRQCISDYIKRGRLSGDALVGDGRSIMIDVEKATAQLAKRLDPDKRLTNGKAKLDRPATRPPITDQTYELSADAAQLMAILSEVPSVAAWDTAMEGETTQRAFDVFANLRLNVLADLRLRSFVLDDGIAHFVDVDWAELAEEMGLTLIDPADMAADWQARRGAL